MSFAKNIGKNLRSKYIQKLLDSGKKSTTNTEILKTVEATGDLIVNKIVDKTTNVSQKSSQNALKTDENEIETPKERYISPEKRKQVIN